MYCCTAWGPWLRSLLVLLCWCPAVLPRRCQANNAVVREFGSPRQEQQLYNHVDLVQLLGIVNLEAGTTVGGWQRARGLPLM